MEENKSNIKLAPKSNTDQTLTLINRKDLMITGVEKVVSIKPDLVQLKSSAGDIVINGQNIEVTKLDLEQRILNLTGKFDNIKYIENSKTPLLKKIFK